MYSACKNRGTAWEFLKFATSEERGRRAAGGHRPDAGADRARGLYPDYFAEHKAYEMFADLAGAHDRGAERAELGRDLAGVP